MHDALSKNDAAAAQPPHPHELRAFRVTGGYRLDDVARAAGYATKRSWWLCENGDVELPAWRWELVQEAANSGKLEMSESARRMNKADVVVSVDRLVWAPEGERRELAQALSSLMQVLEISRNEMAKASGVGAVALDAILNATARRQMTTERVIAIHAVMQGKLKRAGEAVSQFKAAKYLGPEALRDLRLALDMSQRQAARIARIQSKTRPEALLSAYEVGVVQMSLETATRLAHGLIGHYEQIAGHPAWTVLKRHLPA